MNRREFLAGAAAIGCGGAVFGSAFAQSFPSNVIRILVPASASTPPDILARIIASALSEGEGWKVVVENKPGAVMTIGTMEALHQPADGHTLLSVTAPIAAVPGLVPNAQFHLEKDFAPLIQTGTGYNVLVVNPSVTVHSVPELIAFLKKDPGKHTFSSGGFGTPAHLLGELFKLETGVQATHVPYVQFPQAIGDLVNGVNTYQFITVLPVVQLIDRQVACARSHGAQACCCARGCAHHCRGRLSEARKRGLGRHLGEVRNAGAGDRAAQCRHQQGDQDRQGARLSRQARRRSGGRLARGVRHAGAHRNCALVQGYQGRRYQDQFMTSSDFRVTLLGTGVPIPSPDRFGPCTLVEAGEQKFLIDAGRGATIRLHQLKIPIGRIDVQLLTHYHSDHTSGIPDVWLTGWLQSYFGTRKTPYRVIGPTGARALMENLERAYALDIKIRVADEKLPLSGIATDVVEFDRDGVVYEKGGVTVVAFEGDHGDVLKPCYGYRFEYAGRSAVFSSDTRYNQNVIKYGAGADLLVHEVASARPELMKEAYVQRIIGHHTTPREAGRVFAQAKPKLAAYTHIVLVGSERIPPPTIDDVLAETRQTYSGPLALGEDLMAFEIGETVTVRRYQLPSRPATVQT